MRRVFGWFALVGAAVRLAQFAAVVSLLTHVFGAVARGGKARSSREVRG